MIPVDCRHIRRTVAACAIGLVTLGAMSVIPAAASIRPVGVTGQATSSGTPNDVLDAVVATSPTNAWAVGGRFLGSAVPVILHWGGHRWNPVPSGPIGPDGGFLDSIDSLSATNIWAVGGSGGRALIEHWTGGRWRTVPSPATPKSISTQLTAVSALSTKSVWAVGFMENASGGWIPLTMHWNGAKWRLVPCPDPGGPAATSWLTGVAATKTGVWAVGHSSPHHSTHTLVLTMVRGKWHVMNSPDPGGAGNGFTGISAAGTHVLAVGFSSFDLGGDALTLIAHLAGTAFRSEISPDPGSANQLYAVAATPTGGWAVGTANNQTLVLRKQSGTWAAIPSPSWPSPHTSVLFGVAFTGNTGWAVGDYTYPGTGPTGHFNYDRTAILRWTGTNWIKVASPNP